VLCAAVFASPAAAADYACLIEPQQVLKLAAPVQGVVSIVSVDRGDRVRKGQLVASLDSEVEEANAQIAKVHAANDTAIESGRARVDFLKRKQVRNETLRKTDAVSFAQMDEAASDAKVAEAQLREAELNVAQARVEARRADGLLQQRRIISPVDGVVTERGLGPGEFRNDQAHILTVAEMDPLRVETFLPIAAYGHMKVGDKATVLPEAPVGGSYEATVVIVDNVLDAASGTIGVRLRLPNPDFKLPAGIHCKVRFPD
jgi:RND family efflux transporter MFP subunit